MPEKLLDLAKEMDESMKDLRELDWLAMAAKVSALAPPPPMDKIVLTVGFLR